MKTLDVLIVSALGMLSFCVGAQTVRERLERLSAEDRRWVDDACRIAREVGPSAYVDCVERQLEGLRRLGTRTPPSASSSATSGQLFDPSFGVTNSTSTSLPAARQSVSRSVSACPDGVTLKAKPGTVVRDDSRLPARAVQTLAVPEDLVVLDPEGQDGWCRVVVLASGKTGWVRLQQTTQATAARVERSQNVFSRAESTSDAKPRVEIKNDSDRTISLEVAGKALQIPSQRTEAMEIDAGDYKFHATAAGTRPLLGSQAFGAGGIYSWRFWIERRRR